MTYLQEQNKTTIYVSHQAIQSSEEASEMAKKYGAYYYGHWIKNVPVDAQHRQYDQPGQAGHMTVVGCQLWAKNMLLFINEVLRARNIQ